TVVSEVLEPGERDVLVQAAHMHDIGYAPDLRVTGLHQLDGAAWLRRLGCERLARLVAHHSEARFEIELRGMSHLLAKYPREEGAVADALTYCDMTTGPSGEPTMIDARLAEVEQRYGEGTVVVEALRQARPHLEAAVERTEQRLKSARLLETAQPR
ncbi:MAG: phosphohydrolase, partial [Egibacteraceae bacterium]